MAVLLALVLAIAGLAVASPPQPVGVHLHLSHGNSVVALWSLPDTPLSQAPAGKCVYWPAASGGAQHTAPARTYTYTDGGFTGTLYLANLTAVAGAPDTVFEYNCGATGAMSSTFNFTSPPVPGSAFSAIVWADMGIHNPIAHSGKVQDMAAADVQSGHYPLIINAGDTSYADDYYVFGNNSWALDKFWQEVEGSAAYAPMMLAPGNHEDQFHFAAHLNRTLMPQQGTGPLSRFYYSFDYGCVHFISFSTEHTIDKNTEQWDFVMADLKRAQANRDKVPWIVVYTHHPFYCSDLLTVDRCMKQAPHYRAQLEDAFKQYGVDVFVSGHNHNYERSYPVYNGNYTTSYHKPNMTVYIVNGAAGNTEGIENWWQPAKDAPWRAAHNEKFHVGYSQMHANLTTLEWTYIDAADDIVKDKWALTR